jgi:hypothetical protein
MSDELLKRAGELALERALAEWKRDVVDPPRRSLNDPLFDDDRKAIDDYIRNGAQLGGVSNPGKFVYQKDGDYEWCGAFHAHCWEPFIQPDLRQLYWPSTYRLDCYGRYVAGFSSANAKATAAKYPRPAADGRKYLKLTATSKPADVEAFGPRPGDILLVGFAPGYGYGSHVTLVERWDPVASVLHTIEGNATGIGPDGSRRQGVIKHQRPLGTPAPAKTYHALRLIRPGINDVIPGSVK